jgi:O-antigen ligase
LLEHRLPAVLTILLLALLVATYSVVLLQSTDLAVGLFVVGLSVLLLLVEPFYGLAIYILFVYTGPQAYVPALENLRIVFVIGVATLASMMARRVIRGPGTTTSGGPQFLLMGWFLIAVLASRLAHLEFTETISAGYDVINLFVLFILVVRLTTSERRLHQLLVVILLGTIALAAQGIYQHLIGSEIFAFQEFRKGRVTGIGQFVNPNMLAIGLVCGIPIALSVLSRTRNIFARVGVILALIIILYALYLTNSRSGMLSLCVVAGIALGRRFGILWGILIAAVAFFAVVHFGPSRMTQLTTTEESAYNRMLAWSQGYAIFAQNPIFGAGAGSWYEKYRTLVAHNSFIHCVAELGLFGLAPWVMLAFISIKNLWFVAKDRGENLCPIKTYANAILLAMFAFLFASLFISKTYHALYFLLLGLATAAVNVYIDTTGGKYALMTRRDIVLGLLVMGGGLVGFKLFLMVVGLGT